MKTIRQIGSISFVIGLFTLLFVGMPWYVTVVDDPVTPWWFRAAVFSLLGGILIVLLTLALEQRKNKMPLEDFEIKETASKILVLNTPQVPSREITELLGLVQGHTIFAIWLGKDLPAIVRLILGGELTQCCWKCC